MTLKMASLPGSLFGAMTTKQRPLSRRAPNSACAWRAIDSASDVTGWKTTMPKSSKPMS